MSRWLACQKCGDWYDAASLESCLRKTSQCWFSDTCEKEATEQRGTLLEQLTNAEQEVQDEVVNLTVKMHNNAFPPFHPPFPPAPTSLGACGESGVFGWGKPK